LIRAQYDIAHESFAPFNCRSLFQTMLSVDETSRRPPEHRLLRELIEQVWPEVLLVPINPPEKVHTRNLVVGTLKRLRLYQFVPQSAKRFGKRIAK